MSDDWVFELGSPAPPDIQDKEILPYIGEPERWKQYTDDLTYEIDKLIREWIETMCKVPKWKRNYKLRRYTMKMVYEQIYGKEWTAEIGGKIAYRMNKILAYYSSKMQNSGSINGKNRSKTIYTISPSRLKKPPYSLRLRLEWLGKQKLLPTYENMALPKDNLSRGHARNPRTEENMRKRSEAAKQRYNEKYGNRKA